MHRGLSFSLLTLVAAGGLQADFIFSPCSAPELTITNLAPTASAPLACQQFDPGLGTLTQVAFTIGGLQPIGTASLTYTNTTAAVIPGKVYSASVNVHLLDSPLGAGTLLGDGPTFPDVPDINPGQSVTVTAELIIRSWPAHSFHRYTDPLDLATFTGLGTVSYPIQLSLRDEIGRAPGVLLDAYSMSLAYQTQILYIFDPNDPGGPAPIPEPTTAALLALGGAVLLVSHRRGATARSLPPPH